MCNEVKSRKILFFVLKLSGKHLHHIFYLVSCCYLFGSKVIEQCAMFVQLAINKGIKIII